MYLLFRLNVLIIPVAIVVGKYLYIDGGEISRWNGSGEAYGSSTAIQYTLVDGFLTLPGSWFCVNIVPTTSYLLIAIRQPDVLHRSIVIVEEQHCYAQFHQQNGSGL